ncbi:hypothetical protein DFH29DRAFT_1005394 [Suillus ampliporus]|nr:hypothetical protein DFH29DRAFT_1005394 [Suillus ampliporus]
MLMKCGDRDVSTSGADGKNKHRGRGRQQARRKKHGRGRTAERSQREWQMETKEAPGTLPWRALPDQDDWGRGRLEGHGQRNIKIDFPLKIMFQTCPSNTFFVGVIEPSEHNGPPPPPDLMYVTIPVFHLNTDTSNISPKVFEKWQADISAIKDKVMAARYQLIHDFEECFRNSIKDYDFQPRSLVLVWNSKVESELSQKMKPRYPGPMVVVRRTKGGSYMLSELDGSVSKLRYAAFRILPYFSRSTSKISVTSITGMDDEVLDLIAAEEVEELEDEELDIGIDM